MLKYINTLLIFIFIGLVACAFYFMTQKDDLVSTTWVCDQKKQGLFLKPLLNIVRFLKVWF